MRTIQDGTTGTPSNLSRFEQQAGQFPDVINLFYVSGIYSTKGNDGLSFNLLSPAALRYSAVDSSRSEDRRADALAHELGHVVLGEPKHTDEAPTEPDPSYRLLFSHLERLADHLIPSEVRSARSFPFVR
jgi:hypothetical protein